MNTDDEDFFRYKKIIEDRRKENELRYKAGSQQRLINSIRRKMNTNMIGALDTFEKNFGDLWGNGKRNLSKEELVMYETWQRARSQILDRGNANIRAMEDEVSEYDCSWNRYHTEFHVRNK